MRTRMITALLGFSLMVTMAIGTVEAITEVSGKITSNTTWAIGGSPYLVKDSITVQQGVTLTIQPGVVVKFLDGYDDLIVDGALVAKGTLSSPIHFTSYRDDTVGGDTNGDGAGSKPEPDNWGGIVFNDSSDDKTCVLEWCEVRYGGYWPAAAGDRNILVSNASPTISHCTFRDSGGTSIYITKGSSPKIQNCTFSNPGDWPIDTNAMGLSNVGPNTYTGNGHDGVYVRGGNISSDVSWVETGAPLYLSEVVVVDNGSALTIKAGVMIKPKSGYGDLIVNGGLEARGTSSSLIYFTSYNDDSVGGDTNGDADGSTPVPDSWGGVVFNPTSDDSRCVLDYVVVRYGGYWPTEAGNAGIRCIGASPTISNSIISNTDGDGIYCQVGGDPEEASSPKVTACTLMGNTAKGVNADGGSHPQVHGNKFEGNDWPIGMYPAYSGTEYIATDNLISGNTHDGILVYEGAISSDVQWRIVSDAPYVVDNNVTIAKGATLYVAEGVVVKFLDGYDDLIVDGALVAKGTSSSPIYFTSYRDDTVGGDTNGDGAGSKPEPDNWGGIVFNDSSDDKTCVLEWCEVRYGGYWPAAAGDRNILVSNASPTISHCTFKDSGGTSIYISDGSSPKIQNCTFSNPGDWPIDAPATGISYVGTNTYTGNGHDGVYVRGNISSNVSWVETGAPLYLSEVVVVDNGSALTIKAGVMIKPKSGYGDLIVNGGLEARGTSSSRIYFTSYNDDSVGGDTNGDAAKSSPAPDSWGGIVFNPTSDNSRCVLDYVVVRYGGYWPTAAGNSGIRCIGASPTISNSIISKTHGSGIYCESGANPTITTNQIMDNSDYGVCNVDSSVKVNATNNWWGDASGPYHKALNPNGRGNAVSDNVIFDPWLKAVPVGPIVDTIPPVIISGPTVSDITSTSAVVKWATDEESNSVVQYGTTTAYGLSATGTKGTDHNVTLTNLSASTTYHYKVGSTDTNGNATWSKDYTFTTTAPSMPKEEFVQVGTDPDDGVKVDIKQVFASSDADMLSFKVITHRPWGKNMVIAVRINADKDLNTGDPETGVDYMVLVHMKDGDAIGSLGAYNQSEEGFVPIGELADATCKANSNTCQFSVKLSDIGNPDAVDFDVAVGEDLEFAEIDFAPDEGFYTYKLEEGPVVVGKVLFQDDFNDGKMDKWTAGGLKGDWKAKMITASNGVLQQDSNTYDGTEGAEGTYIGTYVYAGDKSWTDYDFQVRMHPVDDDGIGVLFRYVDSSNYYRFLWVGDEGSGGPFIRLDKIVGGVQTVLKYDNGDRTRYDPDNWYTVKVSLSGNQITIYIDDVLWNQATDADITKGMVGLFCYAQEGAQFDDVIVTSVGAAPITDTTPPVITSGPTVSDITPTSAMVKWNTDEASSSIVEYSAKPEYGLTAKGKDNVTEHSVSLTSLSSNTTYYYRVGSTDASGNTAWSEQKTFKTLVEAAGRTLSITSTEALPGAKATVQLSITDATGLAAGDILVKYDASVITVGEVKGTELISGLNLIVNKDVQGEIKLSLAGMKGIPSGSGALVEIGLTVSKDAKVGTETTLGFGDTEIYDESGAVIPVILENGVVKITQQGIKGDVNNDGKVRSNDAMLALRIAAGLMVPSDYQKWSADMNNDGKIRSNDAMLILRKAAGLAAPGKESIASIGKTITIMLGEAHGVAGESITAPLMVDNVHQLASGDICIAYDSAALRAVEVSSDSDVLLQSNLAESGMIRIAFASTDGLNSKTVAEIRFDILADNVSSLTLQQVELYQSDALLVNSQKIDGVFSSWAIPPEHSALLQNFPNPFNPETWIPYQLAEGGDVTIRIYNVKGQLIKTLELGYQPAGIYTHRSRAAYWDGKNEQGDRAASGVYFYQLSTGQFTAMRKLILLK